MQPSDIRVFDNSGKTFDRYTILIGNDIYVMSHNPNSPQGLNQYQGFTQETNVLDSQPMENIPIEITRAIAKHIFDNVSSYYTATKE